METEAGAGMNRSLCALMILLLTGCMADSDPRRCNMDNVVNAKAIFECADKIGCSIGPYQLGWAKKIQSYYPQCWSRGVEHE